MNSKIILLAVGLTLPDAPAQTAPGARVTGSVQDSAGRPISNATVTLVSPSKFSRNQRGGLFPSSPGRTYAARTGKDGAFAITGVPAGEYSACADSTADHVLSSCLFQFPQKVQLSATSRASLRLTLPAATTIEIRVADPQRLIKETGEDLSVEGRLPISRGYQLGALIAGVHYRCAIFDRPRGDTLIYRVTVPEGSQAQLITGGGVGMTTSGGQSLPAGKPSIALPTARGVAGARPIVELAASEVLR